MHFMSGMSERMHHTRGEDQGMLCETITLYQPLTSWPPGSNSNSLNLFFLIFLMGITVSPPQNDLKADCKVLFKCLAQCVEYTEL